MDSFLNTGKKELCSGCRSCQHSCKQECIEMKYDEEGFLYPCIDKSKCIRCGMCEMVCPVVNTSGSQDEFKQRVYAVWHKDENIRMKSSSGGLFSALCKHVFDQKGIVFGCAFDEDLRVVHVSIDNEQELYRLRGSKYVQSDTFDTYRKVKELLEDKTILYSGTPCQIAGLKRFLKKPYENLITVDLICHGVPSPKLFEQYIEYLGQKHKGRLINFSFRNKSKYNSSLGCSYVLQRGRKRFVKCISGLCSPYFNAFLKDRIHRPICYCCPYAKSVREGDITIGDFWGAQKYYKDIEMSKGISLAIINSYKGDKLFNAVRQNLVTIESDIEHAAKENQNLTSSSGYPFVRKEIYQKINSIDDNRRKFEVYLKPQKLLRNSIISMLPQWIKLLLKKIKELINVY